MFLAIQCHADWIGAKDRRHFTVQCSRDLNRYSNGYFPETKCTFSCKHNYYQKEGMKQITCLKSGEWDGKRLQCEGICSMEYRGVV